MLVYEGIERHQMKLPIADDDELFFVLSFGDWLQQQLKQPTCLGARGVLSLYLPQDMQLQQARLFLFQPISRFGSFF